VFKNPATTFSNILLTEAFSSPEHPAWQWLAKTSDRIAGLFWERRFGLLFGDARQMPEWVQPLQILSGIPGVQLRVEWVGLISHNHPFMALWVQQHGDLISYLNVETDRDSLREFSEAAAPCRSVDLTVSPFRGVVDLYELEPVAGSLYSLTCEADALNRHGWTGSSAFSNMTQLVCLDLVDGNFGVEEPWTYLASLTNLQQLRLDVRARGDPSPLSSLMGLTSLSLKSHALEAEDGGPPFGFSSLQFLSTLWQLETLLLGGHACTATSLQGLAGLSRLTLLELYMESRSSRLETLEGISPGVEELFIERAEALVSLAGLESCKSLEKLSLASCSVPTLEHLRGLPNMQLLEVAYCGVTSLEGLDSLFLKSISLSFCHLLTNLSGVQHVSSLKSLEVKECGVTSLQALSQLGEGLEKLRVFKCKKVQEEVLELPHVQPTAHVIVRESNIKLVRAGEEVLLCS
jgi:hypothetical protein